VTVNKKIEHVTVSVVRDRPHFFIAFLGEKRNHAVFAFFRKRGDMLSAIVL
jgi:hypothetical protein